MRGRAGRDGRRHGRSPVTEGGGPVVDRATAAESGRVLVDELRTVWGWLDELVEPGRDSAPVPLMTDVQRARQAEAAAVESAERAAATGTAPVGQRQFLVPGHGALVSARPAARLGILDARVAVHGLVSDAARVAARGMNASYVGARPGEAGVLDALSWLAEVLAEADPVTVIRVEAMLARAVRIAREAARSVDGEHLAPVDHRCPACGHRSLQLDYVSEASLRAAGDDERARWSWTVSCISESCRCAGEGCWCGQRIRYAGRRHAWAYGELSGPRGLWAAIRAADDRRRGPEARVGSEAAGNGGWSERRPPSRVGRAVRDRDGVLWWDRDRACAQLRVKREQLWDWVRRSGADPDWPRLDPPRRDGRVSWYRAQQLLTVEWHLEQSPRRRARAT